MNREAGAAENVSWRARYLSARDEWMAEARRRSRRGAVECVTNARMWHRRAMREAKQ